MTLTAQWLEWNRLSTQAESHADSKRLGVVQIDDSLEQVENSQDVILGEDELHAGSVCVDTSLSKLILENHSESMFALLQVLAECPLIASGGLAQIGPDVVSLVNSIKLEIDGFQLSLNDLLAAQAA